MLVRRIRMSARPVRRSDGDAVMSFRQSPWKPTLSPSSRARLRARKRNSSQLAEQVVGQREGREKRRGRERRNWRGRWRNLRGWGTDVYDAGISAILLVTREICLCREGRAQVETARMVVRQRVGSKVYGCDVRRSVKDRHGVVLSRQYIRRDVIPRQLDINIRVTCHSWNRQTTAAV